MCNSNVPSVTLATAVLMQVQEFIGNNQAFSRYDITKALREKTNNGLLEIPEIENTTGGSPRYFVSKQAVDNIFEQLWRNCLVNGLPSLKVDFNAAGGYRVFSADSTAAQSVSPQMPAPPALPVSPLPPTGAPVSLQMPNSPVLPFAYGTSPAVVSDAEIRRRVTLYMKHCQQCNYTPSLKRIQSAIKRGNKSTGLTKNELANIVMSLGFKST